MRSFSNAKGNSVSNSIMWITGIITALLCIAWLLRTLDPTMSIALDHMNYDLQNLNLKVSEACNSQLYDGKYNPKIEEGTLDVFDSEICIHYRELRKCAPLICDIKVRTKIDLAPITFIYITKDGSGTYAIHS